MEDPEENNVQENAKAASMEHKEILTMEQEEGSDASISEHITFEVSSLENDRSFQEIEILNQPSNINPESISNISQEQQPHSLDLSSFNDTLTNGLPDNTKKEPQSSGVGNATSILEEILNNSQFNSITNSKDDSFNMFANLDLSDKSLDLPENAFDFRDVLESRVTKVSLQEDVPLKDVVLNALPPELDSFREMSNPTYTSSMISATEYRQLQEECHSKLMEYNSAIIFKNDLIQKLSESLDESANERKELLAQVETFKEEIAQLQSTLRETTKMVEEHQCNKEKSDFSDKEVAQEDVNGDMVVKLQEELAELKTKMAHDKEEYETELTRLRELLENIKCGSTELMELKSELEKKHTTEVEELRTYFEKKCVELEKNYSEEIFSQQSRKMSGSSSEADLSGDFLLPSNPGPGGDRDNNIFKNKEDVEKFKETLAHFADKLAKHSLEDIGEKALKTIEIEVRSELNGLLNIGEKLEVRAIESKYLEEISDLRFQLDEVRRGGVCVVRSSVQEVASSGDFELNELVESYERRLQQQIHLAKFDLINELEAQIQRLALSETDLDEDWPSELLQLRDRFAEKYKKEIDELNEQHDIEIAKLKDEHLKILNGALERARRRSLKDGDSLNKGEIELLKERDSLKRQVVSLRNLLTELVQYFAQAEDELNNTLVDQLLNQNAHLDMTLDDDMINNPDASSGATTNSSRVFDSFNKTRVHLAPNFGDLISIVEHHSHHHRGDESSLMDISVDLRNELGMRLDQLRQEANAVLALTQNNRCGVAVEVKEGEVLAVRGADQKGEVKEEAEGLVKQLVLEKQHRERLKTELIDSNELIASLESEKEALEQRLDDLLDKIGMLEADLEQSRYKIAELVETGRGEVVSEGYGEEGQPMMGGLEDTMKALSELQEKARTTLAHSRISADPNVLQLIEELCRVGEKIKEEAKREAMDLLQQIEAADKKYKTTQKFLEEQAAEREQERDEAQKTIDKLYEQLKERDKDRANCEMMSSEPGHQHRVKFSGRQLDVDALQAEHLDQQIQELTTLLTEQQRTNTTLKEELEEAVEKLKIFRDIIKELEQNSDAKELEVQELLRNVERLECIVRQQRHSPDESKFSNSLGDVTDIRGLRARCEELEEEVQKLRIGAELAGSEGALKQIKIQLFEIETNLDKKTKELELLHSTGTNCSSPSEDMSVRDLVRPQTPTSSSPMDDCEVPLQQLARLKEKLVRHSRAEEAAIKRIHDLEMQAATLRSDLEEATNEKDFLKKQTHEQLVLISDFQIRLDEQRVKAEFIEKQTNTSLEMRIHDLQSENFELQDKLKNKEKLIQHQEKVIKETQQRVLDLEREISTGKDDELIVEMQKELDSLRHQLKTQSDNKILPNLVENIIQDKNQELEKLREKLANAEKLLYNYTSLNLDKSDLKTLANLKNSGCSLEHLISILDLSQPEQMRRYDRSRGADSSGLSQFSVFKKGDDTQFLGGGSEPEISEIERVGPSNLNYTRIAPLGKPNSTELAQKSTEKRVHFEDTINPEKLEIEALKQQIEDKNKQILELETKLKILNDFETNITDLQSRLDKTEEALTKTTEIFEKEQQKLAVELAAKKMQLDELEKEAQALREDSVRKDKMYFNLAREKRDLEQKFSGLDELQKSLEENRVKIAELEGKLDSALGQAQQLEQDKNFLNKKLLLKDEEALKLREDLENQTAYALIEINRLRESITSKDESLKTLKSDLTNQETALKALKEELKVKDALVIDKDCDLEIMHEDLKYYQTHAQELESEMKAVGRQEDKLRIAELTKELAQAQEVARSREKQMLEDYNQLRSNMLVINAKMKEAGNVVDLSNRLKAEQKKTADLYVEIQNLKASLMNYELANSAPVDAITGQLKKELECAAQLDSNILSAISDQSLSSISEGHDVEVYMKSLSRQKSQNKQLLRQIDQLEKQKLTLQQQYSILQQKLVQLQNLLEKEKIANKQALLEDAKLIEQLRIQLDGALDYREHLEKLLEEEKRSRRDWEIQCEELKKPNSSSESTKYKSLPSQNALELSRLKNELDQVKLEKDELLKEIKTLKQQNGQLESNVKYTKEMLELEAERNRIQEEKFRSLSEKERNLSEELFRRKFELELRNRELDERKIKVDELEQEKSLLKKQKCELLNALKSQNTVPPTEHAVIPETLEKVIQELKETSEDNKRKLDYIERIESEKRRLEQQLRSEMRSNANDVPFADLVARCNYLFAKALKLDSIRKALVWQKRYLVDFLQSHQRHCLIEVLPSQPHANYCLRRRHSPLQHFRAAVCAVIAIERMKFLVRRWHSGMRKYERMNAKHFQKSRERYLLENAGATTANFQVGQPVSTQNFSPNPFRTNPSNPFLRDALLTTDDSRPVSPTFSVASAIRDAPWSGNSPPCKENGRAGRSRTTYGLQNLGTIPPLQAPQLLSQLHERVELIQEKLSIPFTADFT